MFIFKSIVPVPSWEHVSASVDPVNVDDFAERVSSLGLLPQVFCCWSFCMCRVLVLACPPSLLLSERPRFLSWEAELSESVTVSVSSSTVFIMSLMTLHGSWNLTRTILRVFCRFPTSRLTLFFTSLHPIAAESARLLILYSFCLSAVNLGVTVVLDFIWLRGAGGLVVSGSLVETTM